MPTLSIYLNNETYQKVQENPSKIIQEAIELYFENKEEKEKEK